MSGKLSHTATVRITRDLKDIMQSKDAWGISVHTVDDQLFELKGEMKGPPDTPYEGGKYILDIKVPETYPFKPVKVQFRTKIWHPNISSVTGAICLNILKDDWRSVISLKAVLMSIQALLSAAEPDDPQDAVVGRQYKQNPSMYKLTAEHWARVYAGAPGSNADFETLIKSLVDMGVGEEGALVALSSCDWDLTKAADSIFS